LDFTVHVYQKCKKSLSFGLSHLENLELALEIVRLVVSVVLGAVSWKLYNFFKPGIMHKQWLFIIIGAHVAFFAGLSAILDELGIVEIAQEKVLVSLFDIIFVISISIFAITFQQTWTKLRQQRPNN
jgi:hypothetical protein